MPDNSPSSLLEIAISIVAIKTKLIIMATIENPAFCRDRLTKARFKIESEIKKLKAVTTSSLAKPLLSSDICILNFDSLANFFNLNS